MNAFKSIRKRLEVSQADLGAALGMTQGNIWHYENGQTVPPDVARKLIEYAKTRQLVITFDEIYAELASPDRAAPAPEPAAAGG